MNEIHLLNKNLMFRLAKKNNEYVIQYSYIICRKKKRKVWYNIFENNYEYTYTDWVDIPTKVINDA